MKEKKKFILIDYKSIFFYKNYKDMIDKKVFRKIENILIRTKCIWENSLCVCIYVQQCVK